MGKKIKEIYIVKRVGKKLYLFVGKKRIGLIIDKWVKAGYAFIAKEIKVEGRCVGFGAGWHELSLTGNDFEINDSWRAFRVLIKCPTCGHFKHTNSL